MSLTTLMQEIKGNIWEQWAQSYDNLLRTGEIDDFYLRTIRAFEQAVSAEYPREWYFHSGELTNRPVLPLLMTSLYLGGRGGSLSPLLAGRLYQPNQVTMQNMHVERVLLRKTPLWSEATWLFVLDTQENIQEVPRNTRFYRMINCFPPSSEIKAAAIVEFYPNNLVVWPLNLEQIRVETVDILDALLRERPPYEIAEWDFKCELDSFELAHEDPYRILMKSLTMTPKKYPWDSDLPSEIQRMQSWIKSYEHRLGISRTGRIIEDYFNSSS